MNTPLLNETRLSEIMDDGWESLSPKEKSKLDKANHEKERNFVLKARSEFSRS